MLLCSNSIRDTRVLFMQDKIVCRYFFYKLNIRTEINRAIKIDSSKMEGSIQLGKIAAKVFLALYEILTMEVEIFLHCPLVSGKRNSQKKLRFVEMGEKNSSKIFLC